MAIEWGAYEGSGNQMRVGIETSWGSPGHGASSVTCTIDIYTQNNYSWDDDQTLNYGGSISGSQGFHNGQGDGVSTKRDTKTYTYTYGSSSYGSSPGQRTFTATLSGAFNGITPSKSVTDNIPARPIAGPADPTGCNADYINDSSTKITWNNKDTAGEPWDNVRVDRSLDGGAYEVCSQTIGGGASSYTHTTTANHKRTYRVRAENSAGVSAFVTAGTIWTTPTEPTSVARNPGTGAQQVITWSNSGMNYTEYYTEVQVSRDGGSSWSVLSATVANGVGTYTDTAANAAQKTGYRVRHRGSNWLGETNLFSDWIYTTYTAGATSPPAAPTSLSPTASQVIKPTVINTLSWKHNTTDTTTQTGYQVQWRLQGAGTWTTLTKVVSATSSWASPASTFPDNSTIEWQVRTWGAATTGGSDGTGASVFSATGTFKTVGDPNNLREQTYRTMRMNLNNGQQETSPVGYLPPIGSIIMFGGVAAPSGWLVCQGQNLLRTDYPDLFAVIGTAFGALDGTHFSLPDMRGRFPAGYSSGATKGNIGDWEGGAANPAVAIAAASPARYDHVHIHGRGADTGSTGSSHTHNITGQTAGASVTSGTAAGSAPSFANWTGHAHGGDTGTGGSGHTHNVPGNVDANGVGGGSNSFSYHGQLTVNFIIKT